MLFLLALIPSFSNSEVDLWVFPSVPVKGEPITVSFKISNIYFQEKVYNYELFKDSIKISEGKTKISPFSAKKFSYMELNTIEVGEKTSFVLKVSSGKENFEEVVTTPPYHPHIWSSFVSFASFSTSMAYNYYFGVEKFLNVGVIFSSVLILLLIHVEVTEPFHNLLNFWGRIRKRFTKLGTVLFIIFITMIFSQLLLITNGHAKQIPVWNSSDASDCAISKEMYQSGEGIRLCGTKFAPKSEYYIGVYDGNGSKRCHIIYTTTRDRTIDTMCDSSYGAIGDWRSEVNESQSGNTVAEDTFQVVAIPEFNQVVMLFTTMVVYVNFARYING